MYKVVSLFSGCGGADLGIIGDFEFNGKKYDANPFELEYAVDIDRKALNTHKLNFNCNDVVCGDICDIESSEIPEVFPVSHLVRLILQKILLMTVQTCINKWLESQRTNNLKFL